MERKEEQTCQWSINPSKKVREKKINVKVNEDNGDDEGRRPLKREA